MAVARITIDRILCPTDFSTCSEGALRRAVGLARWFDAGVTALHVIPRMPPPAALAGGGMYIAASDLRVQREASEQELRAVVEPYLADGVPIDCRTAEGDAARTIQAEAEALPADLVVMGTHGRRGFEHFMLGSVAERVLRTAPCPVLSVRSCSADAASPLFRRILCAVDLTAASDRTVDMALSLAGECLARVTLLHVVEGRLGESGPELYRPVPESASLRHLLVEQARERLQHSVQRVQGFCEVSERVETGSAWRGILRAAEETCADLVVVGAHADGAVGRLFFGSTANQVVRQASCPVLVVREVRVAESSAENQRCEPATAGSMR